MLGRSLFFSSNFKIAACASLGFLVASTTVSTVAVSVKNTKIKDVIDVEKFKENLKTFKENLSAGFSNSKSATIEIWNYSKTFYGNASKEFVKLKNFLVTSSAKVSEFFKNISSHSKTFKGYLSKGWSYISSGSKTAYNFLSDYINLENIKKIPAWISSAYKSLKPKIAPAWTWISTNIFSMKNLKNLWTEVKNVKKNFFETSSEFSFNNIKEWGNTWYRVTTKILYPWTKTTIKLSKEGQDFNKLWQYAKEWSNFKELFKEGSKFFRNYQGTLGGMNDQQRETIFKEFLSDPKKFIEKLKILNKPQEGTATYSGKNYQSGENLKNLLSQTPEAIERAKNIQNSVGRATTEVKKLVDSTAKVGEVVGETASKAVKGIAAGIKNSTGIDVSGVAEGAGKVLEGGAKALTNITKSAAEGLTNLISSLFSF